MAKTPREDEEREVDAGRNAAGKTAFPWLAFVLTLVFVPIITILLMEFVVVPNIRDAAAERGEASAAPAQSRGGGAGSSEETERYFYDFNELTANIAGTMGTRFVKVSFRVTGSEPRMREILRNRDAQVTDAIITALSAQTIQEIEQAGGRNLIRNTLIDGINRAAGEELVEALYFTEFILQ